MLDLDPITRRGLNQLGEPNALGQEMPDLGLNFDTMGELGAQQLKLSPKQVAVGVVALGLGGLAAAGFGSGDFQRGYQGVKTMQWTVPGSDLLQDAQKTLSVGNGGANPDGGKGGQGGKGNATGAPLGSDCPVDTIDTWPVSVGDVVLIDGKSFPVYATAAGTGDHVLDGPFSPGEHKVQKRYGNSLSAEVTVNCPGRKGGMLPSRHMAYKPVEPGKVRGYGDIYRAGRVANQI